MVKVIKDSEYKDIIKNNKKVVIDCYADWCGPCRMLAPVVEALSDELKETVFCKINVDDAEMITGEFEIMSIPTLLIFESGKLKDKVVCLRSKSELEEILK